MRQLIDEVEDEGRDPRLRQMRRQSPQQVLPVRGGEELLVADRYGLARQLAQLLRQELGLMRVEAFVVARRAPPLRMPGGDFHRKQAAEDRVAGKRRGGGENAVVVRLLHVEQRRHEIAQHFPLVEPQAVDHDEDDTAGALERGHEELGTDVHRQRRAVALRIGEPARIVLGDELLEVFPQAVLQIVQRFG